MFNPSRRLFSGYIPVSHLVVTSFAIIFLYTSPLLAKDDKKNLGMEEELEETFVIEDEEESHDDDKIIVKGEDEQIIRPIRKDKSYISPTDPDAFKWRESNELLDKEGKKRRSGPEKSGNIKLGYGLYNLSQILLDISRKDRTSLYNLQYQRNNRVSEGYNFKEIANSFDSSDDISVTIGFHPTTRFRSMWSIAYIGGFNGLQTNPFFESIYKQKGDLVIRNQFKASPANLLNFHLNTSYFNDKFNLLDSSESSWNYYTVGGGGQWIYIFLSRIMMQLDGEFHYNGSKDFSGETLQYSKADAGLSFKIPLVSKYTGKGKNIPLQIDLVPGAAVYYRSNTAAVPKGFFKISGKYSFWKFEFYGEKSADEHLPFLEKSHWNYYQPAILATPEEYWETGMKHHFSLTGSTFVSFYGGYRNYDRYYENISSTALLMEATPQRTVLLYTGATFDIEIGKYMFLNFSGEYRKFSTTLQMEPVFVSGATLSFKTKKWHISVPFTSISKQSSGSDKSLDPRFLLDLSVKHWLNQSLSIFVEGKNLLNRSYYEYNLIRKTGMQITGGLHLVI